MSFNDITQTINDVWLFIWPPIVMLLIVFASSRALDASNTKRTLNFFANIFIKWSKHLEAVRKVLSAYSLTKMIPLTCVIVIISFFYLLQGPINQAVSMLPPHVVYRPSSIVSGHSTDREKLLLLRKFPSASSFTEAFSLAYSELRFQNDAKYRQFFERSEIYPRIQTFLKFAVLCLIFFLVLYSKFSSPKINLLSRFLICCTLIVIVWFFSLLFFLFNQEQVVFDQWNFIVISIQKDADNLLVAEPSEREQGMLDSSRDLHIKESWWEIKFWRSYDYEWLRRNFLNIQDY